MKHIHESIRNQRSYHKINPVIMNHDIVKFRDGRYFLFTNNQNELDKLSCYISPLNSHYRDGVFARYNLDAEFPDFNYQPLNDYNEELKLMGKYRDLDIVEVYRCIDRKFCEKSIPLEEITKVYNVSNLDALVNSNKYVKIFNEKIL